MVETQKTAQETVKGNPSTQKKVDYLKVANNTSAKAKLAEQVQQMDEDEAEALLAQLQSPEQSGTESPTITTMNIKKTEIPTLYNNKKYKSSPNAPTHQEVVTIVNNLPEPYNTKISTYIQTKDIKGLQKYLNDRAFKKYGKPKSSKVKIREIFPIEVDNKLGPETYGAIFSLANSIEFDKLINKRNK